VDQKKDVESTIFPFMGFLFEFSFLQNFPPKLHSWLAALQALALVMSPKLGLRQTRYWYTF
jgi:hypothetical protein